MRDPRDYKVDIASGNKTPAPKSSPEGRGRDAETQPYLSVLFKCCNVYQRVYRSADGTRYDGRCPKCGHAVRFLVGEGGTSERFFVVE